MRFITALVLLFTLAIITSCEGEGRPEPIKKEVRAKAKEIEPLEHEEVEISKYVSLETDFGSLKIGLYDNTPKHRDNFIKLVKENYYDDLLFHRVIEGFMIQGGDPKSKGAAADVVLGSGGPGYQVDAEFNPALVHKKGALAAARNNNPEKMSSGSQFYIVQGRTMPPSQTNTREKAIQKNMPGFKYSDEQKSTYETLGGTPVLDMEYTVFGEVVEGLEIIDKIAAVETNPKDRPLKDVKMKITISE